MLNLAQGLAGVNKPAFFAPDQTTPSDSKGTDATTPTTMTSAPSRSSAGDNGMAKSVGATATAAMKIGDVALSTTEGSVYANENHQTDQGKSGDKTIEATLPIGAAASERTCSS